MKKGLSHILSKTNYKLKYGKSIIVYLYFMIKFAFQDGSEMSQGPMISVKGAIQLLIDSRQVNMAKVQRQLNERNNVLNKMKTNMGPDKLNISEKLMNRIEEV
mgnify:CR=1 FL=1